MVKYLGFYWVIDSQGWHLNNTLEDAKKEFGFGMMIFEIKSEDEKMLIDYMAEVKSNRLMIAKLKEHSCPIVYQEGEPYIWHTTK